MNAPSSESAKPEIHTPEEEMRTLGDSQGTKLNSPGRSGSIPDRIGRYRMLRPLGHGGMGDVYLAEDTLLERQVALKIPRFSADESSSVLERFYREARTAARLHHPNICPVFDVDSVDGLHYLTMAFIDGQTLARLVSSIASRDPKEAAALVAKLAWTLDEAHRQGIIHRDLKPSNIMIDRRGEPIVMDFGLARRIAANDAAQTGPGVVLGTPAYMAPEQARGDMDSIGPACDIYSLGVLLFELLVGELPFRGNAAEVMVQHMHSAAPAPSTIRPSLAPQIEAICLKALAKDPCQRFLSMADFAQSLEEFLSGKLGPEVAACAEDSNPLNQIIGSVLLLFRTWGWMTGIEKINALLPEAAEGPPQSRPTLLVRWLSGDSSVALEAQATFKDLRQFPALNGWAIVVQAGILNRAHDFGPVSGLLRAARSDGDPHDNILQAEIARQNGFRYYHTGRLEQALQTLHEALDLCGRDHYLTGWTLELLGRVYASKDNFHAAEELFEWAITSRARRNDLGGVARTRVQLGWLYQEWDRLEQAEEQLQKALMETQQSGDASGQPEVLHYLGTVALKRGERLEALGKRSLAMRCWTEAAELLDASARGHGTQERSIAQAYACNERALVALAQEEHETAEQCLRQAESLFQKHRIEEGLAFAQYTWGVLHRKKGDHAASLTLLQQALAYFDGTSDRAIAAQTRYEMAKTLIASGEVRQLCTHALSDALKRAERCRRDTLIRKIEEELRGLDPEAHWKHVFRRVRGRGAAIDTVSLSEGNSETASVLFLNLQSFVPFCQGRDGDDVMHTLNQMMADLGDPLERQKGFVTSHLGGGFMALFPGPGHAERSVQAALDFLAVVEQFNRPRAVLGLRQLPVRITVGTGSMYLGNIGTYYKMDFTAVGAAVNLTSRLLRHAGVHEPCISLETYRLVGEKFLFTPESPRVVDVADIGRCEVWDVVSRRPRSAG